MKKVLFRITGVLILMLVLAAPLFAIDVYLDGTKIDFDVDPAVINNRTMVPLRAIFEKLGAEVMWDQSTQSATAIRGDRAVALTLGEPAIQVDRTRIDLDATPVAIDGRILVPLRAVSEAFDVTVAWDQKLNAVGMTTSGKTPLIPGYLYENYLITSLDPNNYLKLYIDGNRVYYEGRFAYDKVVHVNIFASLYDQADYSEEEWLPYVIFNGDEGLSSGTHDIAPGDTFSGYFDILRDNRFQVSAWVEYDSDANNAYNTMYDQRINIVKVDGKYVFLQANVYENNRDVMNSLLPPERYLRTDQLSEGEYSTLKTLTDSICEGKTNDYDKVVALHDFLVKSIYYNHDYNSEYPDEGVNYDTSVEILQYGFTQCWGMSIFLTDMCRVQGIPATKVVGPIRYDSLDNSPEGDFDVDKSNHAWNVVYVDGRWIIIDSTWNNHNSLKDGKMSDESPFEHEFFDIELDVISHDHRFDYFREAHDWYGPEIDIYEEEDLEWLELNAVGYGEHSFAAAA